MADVVVDSVVNGVVEGAAGYDVVGAYLKDCPLLVQLYGHH